MAHKIPLLIDTDPGVDDALALLMAFADERHDVVALTIAAGNVGLEYTVRNARPEPVTVEGPYGLNYDPLHDRWSQTDDAGINYMMVATRSAA